MAEMLVRTVDRSNPDDQTKDVKLTKRGDVIVIQPDGWPWSQIELTAPFWCIVKIPGVDPSSLSAFLAEEPGDPNTNPLLQRRAFSFDLSTIGVARGGARTDGELPDLPTALAAKVQKAPVVAIG